MKRSQVEKLAADFGVILDLSIDSLNYDADMWAPQGKMMAASGCHCAVVNYPGGGGSVTVFEFYDAVADDLRLGLVDCEIENCEHCELGDSDE